MKVSLGYEDLPRQTTADYLTGCTGSSPRLHLRVFPIPNLLLPFSDPNERHIAPGQDPSKVPTTPDTLAAAYRASPIYAAMLTERESFRDTISKEEHRREEFVRAVVEDKRKGVGKESPYTVSIFTQIQALVVRQ